MEINDLDPLLAKRKADIDSLFDLIRTCRYGTTQNVSQYRNSINYRGMESNDEDSSSQNITEVSHLIQKETDGTEHDSQFKSHSGYFRRLQQYCYSDVGTGSASDVDNEVKKRLQPFHGRHGKHMLNSEVSVNERICLPSHDVNTSHVNNLISINHHSNRKKRKSTCRYGTTQNLSQYRNSINYYGMQSNDEDSSSSSQNITEVSHLLQKETAGTEHDSQFKSNSGYFRRLQQYCYNDVGTRSASDVDNEVKERVRPFHGRHGKHTLNSEVSVNKRICLPSRVNTSHVNNLISINHRRNRKKRKKKKETIP